MVDPFLLLKALQARGNLALFIDDMDLPIVRLNQLPNGNVRAYTGRGDWTEGAPKDILAKLRRHPVTLPLTVDAQFHAKTALLRDTN